MCTPIYDFLNEVNKKNKTRFFMPGHKGNISDSQNPLSAVFPYDITEIAGADALYEAQGIIGESEQYAASFFKARDTLYSTGGSTLCIQTMLALVSQKGKKIIAGRNAHMAFVHACILLDLDVVWLLPPAVDSYGICGAITANQVKKAVKKHPDAIAVYVTSPDYLGNTADIKAIADCCDGAQIPLLCDNAHGAYLAIGEEGNHPLKLGATMCCDSAHKTLPVLTGGAYLHLSEQCAYTKKEAKQTMNLFGSTSPSYLTLLSLDLCNRYLFDKAKADYHKLKQQIIEIKQYLDEKRISYLANPIDYTKLTLDAGAIGLDGIVLQELLSKYQIECEFANNQYVVLLFSPFQNQIDFVRLLEFFDALVLPKEVEKSIGFSYRLPEAAMTLHHAWRAEKEEILIDESCGRISAQTVSACPPGVPLVMPGEVINEELKLILKNSGNLTVKVVK